MSTQNISYQGTGTSIAYTTVKGLADGSYNSSALVDNATNKYIDALVNGSVQTGTQAADGVIDIYAVGSADGVEFTAGVSAGDGDITWGTTGQTTVNSFQQLVKLGSVGVDTTDDDKDIVFGPYSIAEAFGGIMPLEWAIVTGNEAGATLHATGTNNHLEYTGIEGTVA